MGQHPDPPFLAFFDFLALFLWRFSETGFYAPPPLEGKIATDTLMPHPAPVVHDISGPMGGRFLYTTGAEAENSAVKFSKESVPPLYKNRSSRFALLFGGVFAFFFQRFLGLPCPKGEANRQRIKARKSKKARKVRKGGARPFVTRPFAKKMKEHSRNRTLDREDIGIQRALPLFC